MTLMGLPRVMRYLETLDLPIGDPDDHPLNARRHDEAAIRESLAENGGQYRTILVRRVDYGLQILAGHGTRKVMAEEGFDTARFEVIEADDATARRIVAGDNATSDRATNDLDRLVALLKAAESDGGLAGTGYDGDDLDNLIAQAEEEALPLLAAGSADLTAAIEAVQHVETTAPPGMADLPAHYAEEDPDSGGSGVRATPTMNDYAARYAEKTTRALVMDFPNTQFAWLIGGLGKLRGDMGVGSNAEVLLALVADRVGDTPPPVEE